MTEEDARRWLDDCFDVSRETWDRLEGYVALLLDEMSRQNLIAESTRDHIWARHIVDSAQLIGLAPLAQGNLGLWVDLGSGAGLPGIVVAILSSYQVKMIEMRRKRADFLCSVIERLALASSTAVCDHKVELARVDEPAAVISARAYAPMEKLLRSAYHLSDLSTIWLLPKGQNFQNELDIATTLWHSDACIERSLTAPDSAILVLRNVRGQQGTRRQKVARA